MRIVILISVALALAVGTMPHTAFAVSQAGGISLQFPIGSRYNALGEAGTALSTDMTAIWWNPGGFAFAADKGRSAGIHSMVSKLAAGLADDVYLAWIGGGSYVEGWGMVGGSVTYLNQGQQEGTDIDGNPTDTFTAYQFALTGTFGTKLSDNLGVGVSLKYFRDQLAPEKVLQPGQKGSGQTWAIDAGAHLRGAAFSEALSRVALGVSLSNFGPDITFDDEAQADPMPFTLRFGGAWEAYRSSFQSFTLITDYLISLVKGDRTKVLGAGLEWGYSNFLFVRGGYKKDPEGDIEDVTWGFGVDVGNFTDLALKIDYANVPQAEGLDDVNRFSLTWDF